MAFQILGTRHLLGPSRLRLHRNGRHHGDPRVWLHKFGVDIYTPFVMLTPPRHSTDPNAEHA